MAYIDDGQMKGLEHIQRIRDYLDYLEEHIKNVQRAFNELTVKCDGTWWVGDDEAWHTLRAEVIHHDLSKFSGTEFIAYRQKFFPVAGEDAQDDIFERAWENHKLENHHHHESVRNYLDVVHMIIDWTAMGYKFGDTAQEYYEKNKSRIKITEGQVNLMKEIFNKISYFDLAS